MWKSEKHLCEIGKALDLDIDEAVKDFQKAKLKSNKDKVYKAIYVYFHHRRECTDCAIVWRKIDE